MRIVGLVGGADHRWGVDREFRQRVGAAPVAASRAAPAWATQRAGATLRLAEAGAPVAGGRGAGAARPAAGAGAAPPRAAPDRAFAEQLLEARRALQEAAPRPGRMCLPRVGAQRCGGVGGVGPLPMPMQSSGACVGYIPGASLGGGAQAYGWLDFRRTSSNFSRHEFRNFTLTRKSGSAWKFWNFEVEEAAERQSELRLGAPCRQEELEPRALMFWRPRTP